MGKFPKRTRRLKKKTTKEQCITITCGGEIIGKANASYTGGYKWVTTENIGGFSSKKGRQQKKAEKEEKSAMTELFTAFNHVNFVPEDELSRHIPVTKYSFSGRTCDGTLLLVMENVCSSAEIIYKLLDMDGLDPSEYNLFYTSSPYSCNHYVGERETIWAEKKSVLTEESDDEKLLKKLFLDNE